jgi:hypothetical protein
MHNTLTYNRSSWHHFFMVPPGEVASPFLSTAAPVPAPCVLASFGEGFVVALLFMLPSAFVFGAPACELPLTALPCAKAAVLTSATAAASEIHFIFIAISVVDVTTYQLPPPSYVPKAVHEARQRHEKTVAAAPVRKFVAWRYAIACYKPGQSHSNAS